MDGSQLNQWTRESLIQWLSSNDPNGVYSDEDSIREGMNILSKEEAIELIINQLKG